jgi:hypothetical protein
MSYLVVVTSERRVPDVLLKASLTSVIRRHLVFCAAVSEDEPGLLFHEFHIKVQCFLLSIVTAEP